LADKIVHNLPSTVEAFAEQNFMRGKFAAYEEISGLREELAGFKKTS
jgi:hypothetical protein